MATKNNDDDILEDLDDLDIEVVEVMAPDKVEIIEPEPVEAPKKKKKKEPNIPVDKPLTYKQESFVQNLIAGMSRAQAYMEAYPTAKNWTAASVTAEANKPNVKARYEKLLSQYNTRTISKAFYNRDNLLEDFLYLKDEAQKSIEETGVRQANSNAYASALRNIGEILNLYPDKRLDINATVSNDFEINIINDDDESKDKH